MSRLILLLTLILFSNITSVSARSLIQEGIDRYNNRYDFSDKTYLNAAAEKDDVIREAKSRIMRRLSNHLSDNYVFTTEGHVRIKILFDNNGFAQQISLQNATDEVTRIVKESVRSIEPFSEIKEVAFIRPDCLDGVKYFEYTFGRRK